MSPGPFVSLDELVYMWLIPAPRAQPFGVRTLKKEALTSAPVTSASGATLGSRPPWLDVVASLVLSLSYLLPHKSSLSSQEALWRCF